MKHVALFFSSLLVAGLGFYVVAVNAHSETTPILAFGGGSVVLALLLAFPTDTVAAFQAIAPYLPFKKPNES